MTTDAQKPVKNNKDEPRFLSRVFSAFKDHVCGKPVKEVEYKSWFPSEDLSVFKDYFYGKPVDRKPDTY